MLVKFRTEGVELRVAGDVIKNRDWVVNLGLNMSKNWSEVIKLPENVSEYYNAYTWNSRALEMH